MKKVVVTKTKRTCMCFVRSEVLLPFSASLMMEAFSCFKSAHTSYPCALRKFTL